MKKYIILVACSILMSSCGVFVNKTYKYANDVTKDKFRPMEINLENIDKDFLSEYDSAITFYRIDANIIKNIVLNSNEKYVLFVSFYGFCEYSSNYFDSVYIYAEQNNLPIFVIDNTDWLYQDRTRSFLRSKGYNYHVYAMDINKYGNQFHCRKRWRKFISELCSDRNTELWGYNDIILFSQKGDILLYGDFIEERDKLNNILNRMTQK